MTYTHTGKQVLKNGEHYADAKDEEAARLIALLLNEYEERNDHMLDALAYGMAAVTRNIARGETGAWS